MSDQHNVDLEALPTPDQVKEMFGIDVRGIKQGTIVVALNEECGVMYGNRGALSGEDDDLYTQNAMLLGAFLWAINNQWPGLQDMVMEAHEDMGVPECTCGHDHEEDETDADAPLDASIPKNRTLN